MTRKAPRRRTAKSNPSRPNLMSNDLDRSDSRRSLLHRFLSFCPWVIRPGFLVVAALLSIAGSKFTLIDNSGSDVPYGDQWYGEVACTYAPSVSGEFGVARLFAPHNEHRIVFTRLTDLALLQLN